MNARHLRTLLAVIEHKSFAAAGDAIGLSHSAVSLQIKAMEDELGVLLFDRIKRPPVPTARGRALADHARKTLELFDASASVARGERVRRKLTFGAVPTALDSFLPQSVNRLQDRFPDLGIEMKNDGSASLATRLANGEFDVVICTKPVNLVPGLDWHPIAVEPYEVLAPVDAIGADWQSLLREHPFIWFNRKSWAGHGIEDELKRKEITVNATMEIDSLEAITSLVSEGLGVSIVPISKGKRPFPKAIRHVPFGDPPFSREVGAFTSSGGRSDLVIDAFVDALQAG